MGIFRERSKDSFHRLKSIAHQGGGMKEFKKMVGFMQRLLQGEAPQEVEASAEKVLKSTTLFKAAARENGSTG